MFVSEESVGLSKLIRTCCTSDSVNIVLKVVREIIVDNDFDVLNIDSSCGYISCKQNPKTVIFKSLKGSCTLGLIFVTVNRITEVALLLEFVGKFLGADLHLCEDEDFSFV